MLWPSPAVFRRSRGLPSSLVTAWLNIVRLRFWTIFSEVGSLIDNYPNDYASDCIRTAIVLAPFFVHLEILFKLGYRPDFHKRLNNDIGMEIARIKKIEGDQRRAKEAAKKEL